jgi:hypothetical protein
MNTKWIKLTMLIIIVLSGLVQAHSPAQAAKAQDQDNPHIQTHFTAILNPGEWTQEIIGPTTLEGGYVVDITPLNPAVNGAHVEYKILPEFDGEQWNDVLWMLMPELSKPLKVKVEVFSTIDWPLAFEGMLELMPGELHGFILQDAAALAGYVVEVDPLEPGSLGDTIEQAFVQPEFPGDWYDVLRIQIPQSQPPLTATVRVYKTPDYLPVQAEFDVHLEPGEWIGFVMGEAKDRTGYVIEVTPLNHEDNQILVYRVQPEYNGESWLDVARLMIPADRPATNVRIRIYNVW